MEGKHRRSVKQPKPKCESKVLPATRNQQKETPQTSPNVRSSETPDRSERPESPTSEINSTPAKVSCTQYL